MQQEPEEKKSGLIKRSMELLDSAARSLKGRDRDLAELVDEFTQEMTVVAEGLSEDLSAARGELSELSAAQTIAEEKRENDRRELKERIDSAERRLAALEKQKDRQKERGGLAQILRQVTVIAAIVSGAWVLVTLLRLMGGS